GPTREVRGKIRDLQKRVHRELGKPAPAQNLEAIGAIGMAVWSGLALKMNLFQHPRLVRKDHRMPGRDPITPRNALMTPDPSL
ncbi:MAG: hypothetical protein AABZ66_01705, partial [Candidatus Binatota bacterium]